MVEPDADIRWRRRLPTTMFWFIAATVMWLLMPVVAPFLLLWDVVFRKRLSATRTWFFFATFFAVESSGLIGALFLWLRNLVAPRTREQWWEENRRLQRWWGRNLFWRAVQVFGVDMKIEGMSALMDPHPALVLSRHASTLDTMIPLAIATRMKAYRYVIKAELLFDPAMDIVAQRFPNCFVRRGGDDPGGEVRRVVRLGQEIEKDGAVVIYPEGTRFTTKKRQRLLEKFAENDPDDLLEVVERFDKTLPPLREGVRRLIENTAGADVVFLSHRGIDQASAMSDLIHGRLTDAHLEIKMWRIRAADVPRDHDGVRQFLLDNWELVNAYARGDEIDDRLEGVSSSVAADAPGRESEGAAEQGPRQRATHGRSGWAGLQRDVG